MGPGIDAWHRPYEAVKGLHPYMSELLARLSVHSCWSIGRRSLRLQCGQAAGEEGDPGTLRNWITGYICVLAEQQRDGNAVRHPLRNGQREHVRLEHVSEVYCTLMQLPVPCIAATIKVGGRGRKGWCCG